MIVHNSPLLVVVIGPSAAGDAKYGEAQIAGEKARIGGVRAPLRGPPEPPSGAPSGMSITAGVLVESEACSILVLYLRTR